MDNFNFWQKWLFIVGLSLVIFGLILSFFSQSAFMNFIFNNQVNPVFWDSAIVPENSSNFQTWIYGVLGALVSGWGIFISFVAYYPFKSKERWAWNCIATGIIVWFTIDTIITVHFGVNVNVYGNILILLLVLLPLLCTRKHFIN